MEQLKFTKWEKIIPHAPILINLLLYVMVNGKRAKREESPQVDQNGNILAALTTLRRPSIGVTNNDDPNDDDEENDTNSDICNRALSVAFETLLSVVRGVYKKYNFNQNVRDRDNKYLSSYIQYLYKNPPGAEQSYHTYVELWDEFFRNSHKRDAERRTANLKDDVVVVTNENVTNGSGAATGRNSNSVHSPTTPTKDDVVVNMTATNAPNATPQLPLTNKRTSSRNRGKSVFTKIKSVVGNLTDKNKSNQLNSISSPSSHSNHHSCDEEITERTSLELSWFLYDLIAKSITLEILKGDPIVDSRIQIGDDARLFKNLRSLQHRVGERIVDLLVSTNEDDKMLGRRVNLNMALFTRDLFQLCGLPKLIHSKFPNFVRNLLEDYMLITEIKKESCLEIRLEFVKLFADLNDLILISSHVEDFFGIKFVMDVIHKSLLEADACDLAINIACDLFTKWDHDEKYQSDEMRNEISKITFPLMEKIILDFNKMKKMSKNSKMKFTLLCVHLMKNRNKDEWEEWFVNQGPEFNSNLIKILSTCLQVNLENQITFIRQSLKLSCLDIFNHFMTCMKSVMSKDPGSYSTVIAECVDLFVKFLDKNVMDVQITDKLFLPALYDFIQHLSPAMCKSDKDLRWKSSLGVCLKFAEFPLKNHNSHVINMAIQCLLRPYEIKLAKLTSGVTPFVEIPDDDSNFLRDKNQIKAATLDKLIERVTSDKDMDPKFREIFFLTYRSFTKPFILMEKLIQRFTHSHRENSQEGNKVTLRVINAIKLWVDKHFYDFDNPLICRLVTFLEDTSEIPTFTTFCKNLKKILSVKLMNDDEKAAREHIFSSAAPPPLYPKGKHFNPYVDFDLLAWPSREIARQMTLTEYDYFKKIEPKECLSGAWTKPSKKLFAPNIVALTERWNYMVNYVATTILSEDDVRMRKNLMVKFVEVAQELREMNNFNGVTEIITGFQNASVHRLKKTFELLPQDVMAVLNELNALCNQTSGNSRNMREALARAPPPAIPPLAMYLKDLVFIEDGNPDFIREGLINVFKRRQTSNIILEIKQYQQQPYQFEVVPYVRDSLPKLFKNNKNDDELWELSLKVEPRAKPKD
ncbi:hypothetical protein AKO1_004043 [Acrasis kona]|uniref:Uncharacterized protein n=1 Tax=Acrasis kona TaxID=1008807 RepID=A0AAW2YW41_9EUKA